MDSDRQISERIKQIRKDNELSQAEVAAALNLSVPSYSRRESGIRRFSAGEVAQFSQATGVDVNQIFF